MAGEMHLLGHIADGDLPNYFEACDIFCTPATLRFEAYGLVMAGAMVTGTPIVVTDVAGSGTPSVNIDGVADLAFARLLADGDLRQRKGIASRLRNQTQLNAEQMTQRVLTLYRQMHHSA